MRICVVIPAAGKSSRFGKNQSKLDADLGGKPVLQRTVERFIHRDDVCAVVVAGPHDDDAYREFRLRHGDRLLLLGATLCKGGVAHRWETVRAALDHVPEDATHIAVHDAARPCVSPVLIDRVFASAAHFAAVVPAVAVVDTIKRLGDESVAPEAGVDADPLAAILGAGPGSSASAIESAKPVIETVSRAQLATVQTPQVFEKALLLRAYAQGDLAGVTDDAQAVEQLGEQVVAVEGEATNIKITRQDDVRMAIAILDLSPTKERASHKRF